jgi:hypothetical protein
VNDTKPSDSARAGFEPYLRSVMPALGGHPEGVEIASTREADKLGAVAFTTVSTDPLRAGTYHRRTVLIRKDSIAALIAMLQNHVDVVDAKES